MIQGFVFDQDLIELLDFKLKTGSEVENLKGNNPKVIEFLHFHGTIFKIQRKYHFAFYTLLPFLGLTFK